MSRKLTVEKALAGIILGAPARPMEAPLREFLAEARSIFRTAEGRQYIAECHDIFREAKAIPWAGHTRKWSTKEVLKQFDPMKAGVLYSATLPDDVTYFTILPQFTLRDNRTYLLLGAKRLVPVETLDFVSKMALSYHSFIAARHEFERRIARQGVHTVLFLNLLWTEDRVNQAQLMTLLREIRPANWEMFAKGLGEPKPTSTEAARVVDAKVAKHVAELIAKYRSAGTDDVFLSVIEGDIRYLPRQMKKRMIDARRKATTKKRRPDSLIYLEDLPERGALIEDRPYEQQRVDRGKASRRLDIDDDELPGLIARIKAAEGTLRSAGCGPRVADVLCCYARALTRRKAPTQASLAEEAGMSERQLRNYLAQLASNSRIVLSAIQDDDIS